MSDSKLYTIELGGDLGDSTIVHRLVRCKECVHMSENPHVECGCICKGFGFTIPDQDGFCAWGKAEEDER